MDLNSKQVVVVVNRFAHPVQSVEPLDFTASKLVASSMLEGTYVTVKLSFH
jgi:hypothetical protein